LWLFQIDGSICGGKACIFNGASSGKAILNADDILRLVREVGVPGGSSIYKEGKMAVGADYPESSPLREVAAESGEVGISAGYGGAGGVEAEIADARFCCQRDDEYVVFTLDQNLDILAHPGTLRLPRL
jgi:hypothetical protein